MAYLRKNSDFCTLKFMKTCSIIRFWGPTLNWLLGFQKIFPDLDFALATRPYLSLLGNRPYSSHTDIIQIWVGCVTNLSGDYVNEGLLA